MVEAHPDPIGRPTRVGRVVLPDFDTTRSGVRQDGPTYTEPALARRPEGRRSDRSGPIRPTGPGGPNLGAARQGRGPAADQRFAAGWRLAALAASAAFC